MTSEKKLISDVRKWELRLDEVDQKRKAAKSYLADANSRLIEYRLMKMVEKK